MLLSKNTSKSKLLEFLQIQYSLSGELIDLPSYCDINYLLKTANGDKYVIKIASNQTSIDEIRLENAAMLHLQNKQLSINTPYIITSNNNQSILDYQIDDEAEFRKLRVVSFLEGKLYSQSNAKDLNLQYSLGHLMAQMVGALEDFDHNSAQRKLPWDIAQLLDLEDYLSCFQGEQYQILFNNLKEFKQVCYPQLILLPQQIIHNDANDNNLIVSESASNLKCSGIFDFGDLVYTQRICDLAIAMTYALFDCDDLLQTSKTIVSGYCSYTNFQNDECKILYYLIKARLLQSLLNSGKSYASNPDNSYLLVSAIPAWELLEKLNNMDAQKFYEYIKNN
jgi:Ser/Thr protein kinase RdoA (MazF antagonist)